MISSFTLLCQALAGQPAKRTEHAQLLVSLAGRTAATPHRALLHSNAAGWFPSPDLFETEQGEISSLTEQREWMAT